ncbi:MAG: prepilin peptidase [Pirellulales bacterium]|nr:prepilin peptidase [Pirellulales bacterium]
MIGKSPSGHETVPPAVEAFPLMDFVELPSSVRWAIALWLAALGGCVGSFLNVVVYRLPAGKSLVRPGSHCPRCGHAIRWYDNVPVFGWFLLGGRCRDCREPIAFRYPLIEAVTAALFFGLGWIELLSGGANLPPSLVVDKALTVHQVFTPWEAADLVWVYAGHLLLLCTLLAAALIQYDGHRIPKRLFVPALIVGVVAPFVSPGKHPGIMFAGDPDKIAGITALIAMLFLFRQTTAGLVVGWILGWFAPRCARAPGGAGDSFRDCLNGGVVLAVLCVSFYIGELVLIVGPAALVLTLCEALIRRAWQGLPPLGPVVWLAVLVSLGIAFWRPLAAMWDAAIG